MTNFAIAVTDTPDATGRYHATLMANPAICTESVSRDRAAMELLLAALEAYPPPPVPEQP